VGSSEQWIRTSCCKTADTSLWILLLPTQWAPSGHYTSPQGWPWEWRCCFPCWWLRLTSDQTIVVPLGVPDLCQHRKSDAGNIVINTGVMPMWSRSQASLWVLEGLHWSGQSWPQGAYQSIWPAIDKGARLISNLRWNIPIVCPDSSKCTAMWPVRQGYRLESRYPTCAWCMISNSNVSAIISYSII